MSNNIKTCPLCKGSGMVPVKQVNNMPDWAASNIHPREPCAICNGNGQVSEFRYNEYYKNKERIR